MSVDVGDLEQFYATALGEVARRVIARAVDGFWGGRPARSILGLGFATPYLDAIGDVTARRLAFMPAAQGVVGWPAGGPEAASLVDLGMMPLPDNAVERVIAVHALENVQSASEVLHEVWRVLDPGGRLLLVCPNRRGLWARLDTTPFGTGQPYSRSQLRRLLRDTWFAAEGWAEILYVPPLRSRLLLGGAGAWESLGVGLSLPFAGLHVVDATKQLHRPIPVRGTRRATRTSPVLLPVPATSGGVRRGAPLLRPSRPSTRQ